MQIQLNIKGELLYFIMLEPRAPQDIFLGFYGRGCAKHNNIYTYPQDRATSTIKRKEILNA